MRKFLFISSFLLNIIFIIILGLLLLNFMTFGILHLEMKMRAKKYYGPVAKDLAIICSYLKTDPNMIEVPNIWWPYSVAKLGPIRGHLSSEGASVLFTCGFSHLSYQLKNVNNNNNGFSRWDLFFDDEGRSKLLTTIELSGNESCNFEDMFGYGKWKYESQIQTTDELRRNTEIFLSHFGKTEEDLLQE